jgi:hypothetical protein
LSWPLLTNSSVLRSKGALAFSIAVDIRGVGDALRTAHPASGARSARSRPGQGAMELEVFLNGSVATELAGGQDLEAFAGEFAGWVAAPVEESSRQFQPDDIERLLRLMHQDPSTATVIGFSEFPYTDGGKLLGPDRVIEREYWLQLTNVDKRCVVRAGILGLLLTWRGIARCLMCRKAWF